MPVDTDTVAWIAAAGTAAGALIGSAAGGLVSFALERARERRKALAGARLLRLDLSLTASALRDAEHDQKWWVFRDVEPMPSWSEYADTLTVRLTPEQLEDVTQSVSELLRYSREIQKAPRSASVPYWELSDKELRAVHTMRGNATKAFNALAEVAQDPEVVPKGELLHDKQEPT
jgi:hypothetical protein